MSDLVVETTAGRVRGETVAAPGGTPVRRFLGIPYAAPPVGDLRWRAPRPAPPWPGVRDSRAYGPSCPQAAPLASPLPGFRMTETSEDCLSLNVWTPELAGSRPVMVWIHGGAYVSGGSAQPVYDAARLATEGDVVVVTINYRLGVLGFLALDGDADANCGLRDQLAALAWVREHAGAFGGDPRSVTVFGESAGAGSILHLLGSARRRGAFDRAIVQSGEPRTLTTDEAALVTSEVARTVGLQTATASALRSVPVEQLVAAQADAAAATLATIGMMPFNPAIDGDVCDRTVLDAVRAGRADDVPLVIGTTRDELSLFPDPRAESLDDAQLQRWVTRLSPDLDPTSTLRGVPRAARCRGIEQRGLGRAAHRRVHADPEPAGRRRPRGAGRADVRLPLRLGGAGDRRRTRRRCPVHVRDVRSGGVGRSGWVRRSRRARQCLRPPGVDHVRPDERSRSGDTVGAVRRRDTARDLGVRDGRAKPGT